MKSIYLDYNASTPLAGAVRQAIIPFLDEFYAAPGNPHWQSRAVEEAMEDSRSHVASMLGCHSSEIVFTSGGTESAQLAILGYAKAVSLSQSRRLKPHAILSTLEHSSVVEAFAVLEQMGWSLSRLPCDELGSIDPNQLKSAIRKNTRLISIQLANRWLGCVQDIAALASVPRPVQCAFHTDATQAVGKIEVDIEHLNADLLSISAHRMYGPKGIGALFIKHARQLSPIGGSGAEENGLRPGLLNPSSIVGFGVAAQLVKAGCLDASERLMQLRERLLLGLTKQIERRWKHFESERRLPNTVCLSLQGLSTGEILTRFPELHVGIPFPYSMTSEDSYLKSPFPGVSISSEDARDYLSISLGWNTTEEEIDRLVDLLSG
jgi:cysteine desulfurase